MTDKDPDSNSEFGEAVLTSVKAELHSEALQEWIATVGKDWVMTTRDVLEKYSRSTYQTDTKVSAVIFPASIAQVLSCVRTANKYKIPVFPISKGKNWGLGSSAPVTSHNVVLCLERMNEILGYDEELAIVKVQPGVTFNQLHDFLRKNKSELILDVTGADGDTSIIGNTLERGHGMGMLSDRFSNVTDFEVVLGNGQLIHSGFTRFGTNDVSGVSKWAVGPEIQGLFSQSSFGVVTALTLWLQPRPKQILPFFMGCNENHGLSKASCILSRAKMRGSQVSFRFFNDYRMFSFVFRYPQGQDYPLSQAARLKMRESLGWASPWNGFGAIYGQSEAEIAAVREELTLSLRSSVDTLAFFPSGSNESKGTEIEKTAHKDLEFADEFLSSIRSSFLGSPISGVRMCYWRMDSSIKSGLTPERDGCGVIWICPKIPTRQSDISTFVDLVENVCAQFKFEPNIGLLFPTSRSIDATVAILYDRTVAGEDAKAKACHRHLFDALVSAGYLPYRLATQSMGWLPQSTSDRVFEDLKKLFDPNNIIAPGRYS